MNRRILQLQTGHPHPLSVICVVESKYPTKVERVLHRMYQSKKAFDDFDSLKGEWFKLDVNDVLAFKETCQKIESRFEFLKEAKNLFV